MAKICTILFAISVGLVAGQYSSNGGSYGGNGGAGPQSRGAYSGLLAGFSDHGPTLGRRVQGAYGAAQSRGIHQSGYGRQAQNGGQGAYGVQASQKGAYGAGARGSYGPGSDDGNFEPANYEFSYEVSAPEYGVEFGHEEQRQGEETTGNYRVLLPDGRRQIVDYTANQDGYKPTITYEETGAGNGAYGRTSNGYGSNGYGAGGRAHGNAIGHRANGHVGNGNGLGKSGNGAYANGNGFGRSGSGAYGGSSDSIVVDTASRLSAGNGGGAY